MIDDNQAAPAADAFSERMRHLAAHYMSALEQVILSRDIETASGIAARALGSNPDRQTPPPSTHVAGWQDISTAPKNTKVLAAYRNELGNWRIVTACYHTQLDWSDEYGDHEQEFAPEDWYEESDSSEVIYPCSKTPTLWMPLPHPDAAPDQHAGSVQALLNSLDRTAIAKIVDPSAWMNEGGDEIEQDHSGTSLRVADQIITYVLRKARALATTEGSVDGA